VRAEVLLDEDHAGCADYAAGLNEQQAGMKEMSEKFKAMGGEVYLDAEKVKESNKAL
jgi:phosphomethylpyrimidine synthase